MQSRLVQSQNFYAKPFLKWMGGKGQLLKEIDKRLPKNVKNNEIDYYYEPFVGAGSVFFHLKNNYSIKTSIISDINPELILTYRTIQKDYKELIKQLNPLKNNYKKLEKNIDEQKDYYKEIRDKFNDNLGKIDLNAKKIKKQHFERAAQMIFLNKTCFNGMFRVNKKGEFNVPAGRYKNPQIYDENNLIEINKLLNKDNVIIKTQDFSITEDYITEKSTSENTFIYLDPPYRPLNKTSSFTQYYKNNFDDSEQIRLYKYIQRLSKKKIPLMLSNSDSKTEDNQSFFRNLYQNQKVESVKARRNINANGKKRNAIDELIITNY